MLRGSSGFYSYAIYQRDESMPAFNLNEARIAFMLNKQKYDHFLANFLNKYIEMILTWGSI